VLLFISSSCLVSSAFLSESAWISSLNWACYVERLAPLLVDEHVLTSASCSLASVDIF
jgi:hypothetical protein